jgi:DNA-binding GntR family transcriptional regulator
VTYVGDSNHDQARVYNELKMMVMIYRFRPGQQLLIGELANRLRVSSTPVREALIRLQAEGLLDPMPRRGFFARMLNVKEMVDLFECGALILKQALVQGSHAVDTRIREDFRAFMSISVPHALAPNDETELVAEPRVKQCADYLEQMYRKIASFSLNEIMISIIGNIVDRTHYIRLIDLEMPNRFNCALRSISEVASAVQAGDVTRAVAALDRDFDLSIERMPALVREGVNRAYPWGTPAPLAMHTAEICGGRCASTGTCRPRERGESQ